MWIAIKEPHIELNSIRNSGILYDKVVITSPIHDEVIAFPEEEWDKVTNIFALPVVDLQPTNLNGIFFYNFTGYDIVEEKPKVDENSPKVIIESWNGMGREKFEELTVKMLLPVIKKDIIITVPHGYKSLVNNNPKEFHIRIWSQISTEEDSMIDDPPTKYWEIPISCMDSFFNTSGTGVDIVDSEGSIVAELVDSTLFIHHDLVHYGEPERMKNQLAILSKIYEGVIQIYKNPEEVERLKRDREVIEFTNIMKSMFSKRISNATKILDKQSKVIEEYRHYLVTALRDQTHAIRELNLLTDPSFNGTGEEKIKTQWKELTHIPGIVGVKVSRGKIVAVTDLIFIKSEEITYELGPFEISIDTNNSSIKATTFGSKGTRSSCHHPHIGSGGNICFGNLSQAVTDSLVTLDIPILINLVMELLHNYTSGDAYEQIIYFKQVKDGKTKEKEKTG